MCFTVCKTNDFFKAYSIKQITCYNIFETSNITVHHFFRKKEFACPLPDFMRQLLILVEGGILFSMNNKKSIITNSKFANSDQEWNIFVSQVENKVQPYTNEKNKFFFNTYILLFFLDWIFPYFSCHERTL